jgi:hypothetical protein
VYQEVNENGYEVWRDLLSSSYTKKDLNEKEVAEEGNGCDVLSSS